MKVLRIYDHLGELKKELNLYVEGEDFKWQSSYPEPIWLGTITLEDAGTEPEKPSESASEPLQPEIEVTEENPLLPTERTAAIIREASEYLGEEVKGEPKKDDRKRSRVKRSTPSASPESTKGLYKNYFGGDTPKGD